MENCTLESGWDARLELAYARREACTIPVHRRHIGPLRVQKHFTEPSGVCQHIVVHPPGGIAGGDSLTLELDLAAGSRALLTSPGAAKWYQGFGRRATQRVSARIGAGASLEWLPLETILFNGADVELAARFDLARDAVLLYSDVVCLGRPASAEPFAHGCWRQTVEVWRDDALLWCEHNALKGDDAQFSSPVGMDGHTVTGLLLWAGPALPEALLDACRAYPCVGRAGVSQLPDVFVARCLTHSAEAAQAWITGLWQQLRPFTLGVEAVAPRIWAT
ncbi:urease accessory protein UreD [Rhodobacteraceae bacterium CH30]|uniref:Urease accessory protein UreD n=2 Tax=Craterilacuibacter sinensis TaxID=2686017 RepID=A0A845BNT3_9NEIS|nr:urease accessory protein UreD [Craterilacuibacter sinensis]RQW29055.1 urease accessory protein UreD [Rhodobacteraceae bacterium CH30]